jgi:hypothetical protein
VIVGRRSRHLPIICTVLSAAAVTSCARRPPALPGGAGTPLPDYAAIYAQATAQCGGVRTFAGLLELSGRAAGSRLPRARIEAGFAAPNQIRLEARAPVGRPIFVLAARRAEDATLLLPRDKRVLSGAPADVIIEALTGVLLGADDLRAIVSGCGPGLVEPTSGRMHDHGWIAIVGGDLTVWLRRVEGVWRIAAAARSGLEIRYDEFQSGRPAAIRIRTSPAAGAVASDLTIRVSDVDINVPLGPVVFQVEVPEDAAPLTLDELRRAGPLGEAR